MSTWEPRHLDKGLPIDFFARRIHFIDHLASTWNMLPEEVKGKFYIPELLRRHARKREINVDKLSLLPCKDSAHPLMHGEVPFSQNPMVTCAYGDMFLASKYDARPLILMEHGVGLIFKKPGTNHYIAGYGGGEGLRTNASAFMPPNIYIQNKILATFPTAIAPFVGTPKLDKWKGFRHERHNGKPRMVISFHWDGSAVAPEAGNAFDFYRGVIPSLAKEVDLRGHGHPKIIQHLKRQYERMGIEVIEDFEEVMSWADLYINDASSTLYEFSITGKPVLVLNCPQFRRHIDQGIRFWDYSDIGINCNKKIDLITLALKALDDTNEMKNRRRKYMEELYPFFGYATRIAVTTLLEITQ